MIRPASTPTIAGDAKAPEVRYTKGDVSIALLRIRRLSGRPRSSWPRGTLAWRDIVRKHHTVVRRKIARFRGVEMDTAGDGFFARFDGPTRAIRCACAIASGVKELGIDVRAGLHTGECEVMDGKVGDLVSGSGLRFEALAPTELKGIPGTWSLHVVDPASA